MFNDEWDSSRVNGFRHADFRRPGNGLGALQGFFGCFVVRHFLGMRSCSSVKYSLPMSVQSPYTIVRALKVRRFKYGSTTHSATAAGRTYQSLSEPARLSALALRRNGFE